MASTLVPAADTAPAADPRPRSAVSTGTGIAGMAGLLAWVAKLDGVARLRPDSKLVVTRTWGDPKARLHGALQLSKGLAKAAG